MKKKGVIALDIDGTITNERHLVPDEVTLYLAELYKEGWDLMFVTGRVFSYAMDALGKFNFPFLLAVQNGADLLQMPEKKVVSRHYLSKDILLELEELYKTQKDDFLVYAGYEEGDFCYYRPKHFSHEMYPHLLQLQRLVAIEWQPVEAWSDIKQLEFPLIKCIAPRGELQAIASKLLVHESLQISVIKDPASKGVMDLMLITHRDASKGQALDTLIKIHGLSGPIIAAGDDANDISMIERATVKIVINTAPKEMHSMADILAASSKELGIIKALEQAITMVGKDHGSR